MDRRGEGDSKKGGEEGGEKGKEEEGGKSRKRGRDVVLVVVVATGR